MEKFIIESVVHSEGGSIASWCDFASTKEAAKEAALQELYALIHDEIIMAGYSVEDEKLHDLENTFLEYLAELEGQKQTRIVSDLTENEDFSIVFSIQQIVGDKTSRSILSVHIDEVLGNSNMSALIRVYKV